MMPFDLLFPELAGDESRVFHVAQHPILPDGTYVLREHYCTEPGCDCRRVILHVHWVETRRIVAGINYGFEPPAPPFEDEGQIFIDPLNPQSEFSEVFLRMIEEMLRTDRAYHDRLVRHYGLWKRVVDDPRHPEQAKLRSVKGAPPPREPIRRAGPKIGANAPCPCGSGKKLKRCCLQ